MSQLCNPIFHDEQAAREWLAASPDLAPMGGQHKFVEADEAYTGGKAKNCAHREPAPKKAAFFACRAGRRGPHLPSRLGRPIGAVKWRLATNSLPLKSSSVTFRASLSRRRLSGRPAGRGQLNESIRFGDASEADRSS